MSSEAALDKLRTALARAGVGRFASTVANTPLSRDVLAELVRDLAASDDARLVASLPCLLTAEAERGADAISTAAAQLDAAQRTRLGLLVRISRALAVSRAPNLAYALGRQPQVPPSPVEPDDLPPPDDDYGEHLLAVVREREREGLTASLVGDAEDLFDTWLRLAARTRPAPHHA